MSRYNILLGQEEKNCPETDLNLKVKYGLTNYLEFDIDLLARENAYVYGGSIRDIIVGDKINDIDILVPSKQIDKLINILRNHDYIFSRFVSLDISNLYFKIGCISEPFTLMKNGKIVQLIRPSIKTVTSRSKVHYSTTELLNEIDISCCSLAYNTNIGLIASDEILKDCKNKIFQVYETHKMFNIHTIDARKTKLIEKGWIERIERISGDQLKIQLDQILQQI